MAFMCFVWISEQTENLPWLIPMTEVVSVYCAIRTEYITQTPFVFEWLNPFAGSLALHLHTHSQLRSKTCIRANDQVAVNTHEGSFTSIYVLSLRVVTSHVTPEFRGTHFGKCWHSVTAFLVVAWEKYDCISQSLHRYKSRLILVDCICCETVSQSQRSQAFSTHSRQTLNRIKNLLRPVVI